MISQYFMLSGQQVSSIADEIHVSVPIRNWRPLAQTYCPQQPRVQSLFSQLKQPSFQPQKTHDDS